MLHKDDNGEIFYSPKNDRFSRSMTSTFLSCPRKFMYNYVEGLIPVVAEKPLERGKWFHALLEAHYSGRSWKKEHMRRSKQFSRLFDEEVEKLGELPTELKELMFSYLWHYKEEESDDAWNVLETEKAIEVPLYLPTLKREVKFVAKFDMLVETAYGLYLVDHKTHKRIPSLRRRELDTQSPLYIWACREAGIPVQGFTWNYVKTEAISAPKLVKDGSRFSKTMGDTTYWRMAKAIKDSFPNDGEKSIDLDDAVTLYRPLLDRLKSERYSHGVAQTSPFFVRHTIERNDHSIDQAVRELTHNIEKILTYNFDKEGVARVESSQCEWACSYSELCTAELYGRRTDHLMRRYRSESDPLHYHRE